MNSIAPRNGTYAVNNHTLNGSNHPLNGNGHQLNGVSRAYRQTATLTASPTQVVLILFDGVTLFTERALRAFEHEDPIEFHETVHNNILRAQAILRELNLHLDMEKGGKFAETMRSLYEYFDWRLQRSNIDKKPDGLAEVSQRMATIRDAWAEMMRAQTSSASAPNLEVRSV